MFSRARAQVDYVVRGTHDRLVVLNDQDGVAQVSQPFQGVYQTVVVRRMQPDRGLVANIEYAHEPAAYLSGQPDSLGLAAAESARRPVQRQVVKADPAEEGKSRLDLL